MTKTLFIVHQVSRDQSHCFEVYIIACTRNLRYLISVIRPRHLYYTPVCHGTKKYGNTGLQINFCLARPTEELRHVCWFI